MTIQPCAGATEAERITELERKVDILTRELERRDTGEIFTEVGESAYGLGPAASKIYARESGLSIGGYGEALYRNRDEGTDDADFLRAVLYFGYKFNPKWVLNTELEFEHASTSEEGSVSVEFAYLDYLFHESLNFRAGLVLLPMGLLNELHEPTVFLAATRPVIEQRIIPSTWRENGVGFFGGVGPLSYKTYVVNGLQGEEFTASGLRDGRQKGSEALAEDLAWVGRLDWNIRPGLLVGGSLYYGDSGQDIDPDLSTTIADVHFDWHWKGLNLRAVGVSAEVDDVSELNDFIAARDEIDLGEVSSVGEELQGWYAELGYDVLTFVEAGTQSLTPYLRIEQIDTQDKLPAGVEKRASSDLDILTVGLNYKPLDQIVFKAEWQQTEDGDGDGQDQVNVGMGYVF